MLQDPLAILRSDRFQLSGHQVEDGAKAYGNDGAHKTDNIIRHAEVRSREGDQKRLCMKPEGSLTMENNIHNNYKLEQYFFGY